MDFDFITHHALNNVWCTPRQDKQVIIKPARLTTRQGAFKSFRLMWRDIPLPDQINRWHIYQIGGTHPLAFNLFARCYTWVNLATASQTQSMIADLYTGDGYKFPLFDTFYSYTADHNLVVAVRINSALPMVNAIDDVYLRVYSNAFFQSPRSSSIPNDIRIDGALISSAVVRNQLKVKFNQYRTSPTGYCWLFVNGIMHENWDDSAIPIGSYTEIIHDSSVKKVLKLDISEFDTFQSVLDDKLKYIVHYAGADDGTIDYQDDIDVYLMHEDPVVGHLGLYYNKNNEDGMRNLTHRDYSIVASYVKRFAEVYEKRTIPRGFLEPTELKA